MIRRFALMLFLAAGVLAGCGENDVESLGTATSPSASNIVSVKTVQLDDQTGGSLVAATGHTVRIPAGALSDDTLATLTVLAEPPRQPADPQFRSVGRYIQLDLGEADLEGDVEIEVPYDVSDPDSTYLQLVVDDVVVPLPSEQVLLQAAQGEPVVKARFNPGLLNGIGGFDSSNFVVGVGESSDYDERVPHRNWPSWNAYIFQDGGFQPYVQQGEKLPIVFNPGSKPVVLVHGFGSDASRFLTVATTLENAGYTSVIAFEYDTLAPVESSGQHLKEFYDTVAEGAAEADWHHLAHSMGVLVSRDTFETQGEAAYAKNSVVFAGGANLGSPVVDRLIARPSFFDTGINFLLSNDLLDFRNADGSPCKVTISDRGFQDLASTSEIVNALTTNPGAHPRESYRTVAGTSAGKFALGNLLLGTTPRPEDGVITLSSANADFIGAEESTTVAFDHVAMLDDTTTSIPRILELLARTGP